MDETGSSHTEPLEAQSAEDWIGRHRLTPHDVFPL